MQYVSQSSPNPSPPTSPQAQAQAQAQTFVIHSPLPRSQGNSTDGTPRSSTQPSPTFNLSREYTLALQSNSYNEMRYRIQEQVQIEDVIESENTHQLVFSQALERILVPNKDSVEQALRHTNPKATLTRLVSTYFDHSENITNLCLFLRQCLHRARNLYSPVTELLQVFPYELNSINQLQCNWAFDVLLHFDSIDNPFPCPGSHNFNTMRLDFSQLGEQLDRCLSKYRSRIRFLRRVTTGSAICLIGTAIGVVVSVVVISTHALSAIVGLVATPLCPVYVPTKLKKKQLSNMAQLDAATQGTYFNKHYLDNIDRLVNLLYTTVEGDKQLIRFGLERGKDIYPIHEVVRHLRNNHEKFFDQLKELEEHIYLCFNAVNRFRAKLLDQIHLHQSSNS